MEGVRIKTEDEGITHHNFFLRALGWWSEAGSPSHTRAAILLSFFSVSYSDDGNHKQGGNEKEGVLSQVLHTPTLRFSVRYCIHNRNSLIYFRCILDYFFQEIRECTKGEQHRTRVNR